MKKIMLSFMSCLMLFSLVSGLVNPVFAEGMAPEAESFEIKTKVNTPTHGALLAKDAEDDVVAFEITTKPIKGDIQVEPNGNFVYTPREGKKGRDYFGYKAYDSQGNISHEATVIIRIEK